MLATLIQIAQDDIPVKDPVGLEVVMLQEDKLFVVLAVVLIIWLGVLWYLYRTDREIDQLEERLDALPEASDSL